MNRPPNRPIPNRHSASIPPRMCLILNDRKCPNPESRHSFRNKMMDPETTTETKFAQLRQQIAYLTTTDEPDKLKPSD